MDKIPWHKWTNTNMLFSCFELYCFLVISDARINISKVYAKTPCHMRWLYKTDHIISSCVTQLQRPKDLFTMLIWIAQRRFRNKRQGWMIKKTSPNYPVLESRHYNVFHKRPHKRNGNTLEGTLYIPWLEWTLTIIYKKRMLKMLQILNKLFNLNHLWCILLTWFNSKPNMDSLSYPFPNLNGTNLEVLAQLMISSHCFLGVWLLFLVKIKAD